MLGLSKQPGDTIERGCGAAKESSLLRYPGGSGTELRIEQQPDVLGLPEWHRYPGIRVGSESAGAYLLFVAARGRCQLQPARTEADPGSYAYDPEHAAAAGAGNTDTGAEASQYAIAAADSESRPDKDAGNEEARAHNEADTYPFTFGETVEEVGSRKAKG
jgi:hypothetical protein